MCRWQTRVLLLLESGAGECWLAIGDARIAPDPLSGQGIIWAFDDAISVMELLTRMEWHDLAREMGARTVRDVNVYRVERSRVYSHEQRFKNDAYWIRSQRDLFCQGVPSSLRRAEKLLSC